MHGNAYAIAQRETLSGRALEREVFSRITARLSHASAAVPAGTPLYRHGDGNKAYLDALMDNKRLWMTLAVDLAHPDNRCPDQLKAALISLAAFVERHTQAVIEGTSDATSLMEINRLVEGGLSD